MAKKACIAVLLALTGAWDSLATEAASALSVTAAVGLTAQTQTVLTFKMINQSGRPLTFDTSSLPWGVRYSVLLVAVTNDANVERIAESLPIQDPAPSDSILAPKGEWSGIVNLVSRFPELPRYLKSRDIIVFWSYQPTLTDGTSLSRASGSVLLHHQVDDLSLQNR
jgi:hypothetical protein